MKQWTIGSCGWCGSWLNSSFIADKDSIIADKEAENERLRLEIAELRAKS